MPTHLLSMLSEVPDPRRAQGKVYALGPVLLFAVLAMLAGAKSYRQIHSFIKLHRGRLNAGFGLAWRRTPAYTSVRGILQGLNPADLERVFRVHSRELWRPASDAPPLIAIDGKTLRRSFDSFNDRKAAHVLSAFASEDQLILGHLPVDGKSNEIPAAQQLIEDLGLTGCLFTLDAMHCQKNFRDRRGHRQRRAGAGQGKPGLAA